MTHCHHALTRRQMLHTSAGAFLAAAGLERRSSGQKAAQTVEKSGAARRVLQRLRGSMASITIPYDEDLAVDHDSLRQWVSFMCDQQAPVLFMTLGDSELDFLSEEEIEAVIRTVVEEAKGRILVVGGTGPWGPRRIIPFIERVTKLGVDAINVHFHARITGTKDLRRAFGQVAEASAVPLLGYESAGNFDLPFVEWLASLPNVVGMKCHDPLYTFYDYARATRHCGFSVLGAGLMRQFLFGHQVGSPGYLCLVSSFAPSIGRRFCDALRRDDLKTARELIFRYEEPLVKVAGGFPHTYKSLLHLTGHYRTNLMRSPRVANDAQQLARLRRYLTDVSLLSRSGNESDLSPTESHPVGGEKE